MSDTLRHFIRESLLVEIEQTTWMKGSIDRAVPKPDEPGFAKKAIDLTKKIFGGALNLLGARNLFSGNRKKSAWGRRVGIGAAVTGSAALLSWLFGGKKNPADASEQEVSNAEDKMLEIESQLGGLFSKSSSTLMNDIMLDVDGASIASKPMSERIKLFREHFEKVLSNAAGIRLRKSFTSGNIETASDEYNAVISKIRQFGPIKAQINSIVGEDPAAKAWASRLIVARHALDIQLAIGTAAEALISDAKDEAEQQQVNTTASSLAGQFSNIDAFKTAYEAVKDE